MADENQVTPSRPLPFEVFFEDQHLIVFSKPAGLLSQGDQSGEENLVDILRAYFGRNYVGLIHRLDRNTSGLMVVAKRSKSADRLSEQLKKGELVRKYRAFLFGELQGTHRWEHWLLKNESTNEVRVVKAGTSGAKQAVLQVKGTESVRLHDSGKIITIAEFELETGRSHQIRVQSAAMQHPLLGDTKYGHQKSVPLFPRPALHSCYLGFFHPMTREIMSFEQRYSSDMIEYLTRYRVHLKG